MIYHNFIRPLLFTQDPETAHERTLALLEAVNNLLISRAPITDSRLRVTIAGIEFPNPVGLAAGCDKNGRALHFWPHCGFGFIEVGTITAQPQPGNPKPRVFRFANNNALVNRLGFNSEGSQRVAERIAKIRAAGTLSVPLGINIGKTKIVEGDEAILEDYRTSFRRLAPLADFIVVNVSSPNTPGLRNLQQKEKLRPLLEMLIEERVSGGEDRVSGVGCRVSGTALQPPIMEERISRQLPIMGKKKSHLIPEMDEVFPTPDTRHPTPLPLRPAPVYLKISPDMSESDMEDVVEVALETGLSGIIATNTTIARFGETEKIVETGGLSGHPLCVRANEVIRFLHQRTRGRLTLIGVGGIFTADDAYQRIKSGASLVQLYTGLIYEGPYLPKRINQGLIRLMERDGVSNISEVVGIDVK